MDDKINENKLDENLTQFASGPESRAGGIFTPDGALGRFFAKFFSRKAAPYVGQAAKETKQVLVGDAVGAGNNDVIKPLGPAGGVTSLVSLRLPVVEQTRRERYKQFDSMDDYPEISTGFDIYADDSTQKDTKDRRWRIKTDSQLIADEVKDLFENIKLDKYYWDIVRNTIKYGDCFVETIVDLNDTDLGIQRLKILNPYYVLRKENEFGYLDQFLQEIPKAHSVGMDDAFMGAKREFITLDKNQLLHFRMYTSDPAYYPYGRGVASAAIRSYRNLKLMEDAMIIYRLSRAPERRIFYVDVGQMPTNKAELYIESLKSKFKKEKFYNSNTGNIDARYNPLSVDEDFFVPTRGSVGTKIDTLPGAQNLGEIDDVRYFRDKVLAAMKIPKDYVVEHDKTPERKGNLSQLDAKFAKTIMRVQNSVEVGFTNLAKRHLALLGLPYELYRDLRVNLPEPSDIYTRRKLEIDEMVLGTVQGLQATGLFPKNYLYKQYFDLDDREIEEITAELSNEKDEEQQGEVDQTANMAQADAAGTAAGTPPEPAPPGAPPAQAEANSEVEALIRVRNRLDEYKDEDKIMLLDTLIERKSINI